MNLTPEQQAILNGEKGEVLAKVMKTLVMYGDAFGAEKLVPVTSKYGHTVISFGINTMKPVYDLYDQLLASGVKFQQKFTADPLPLDPNVPSNLLQDLVFKQFMYKLQPRYEEQLRRMGMKDEKDFTCACYFDEVGNIPEKGEVLSWAESSAVVYANSVLGARCNRNSGIIDVMGSMLGYVPYFGLLTDEVVASYKHYPLIPLEERIAMFEGLKYVSRVVVQESLDYTDILNRLRPDIVVHGDDWLVGYQANIRQKVIETLKGWGGELVEFPYTHTATEETLSTLDQLLSLPETRRSRLRRLLHYKPCLSVMEAHDGLTGLIVEKTTVETPKGRRQFDAIWVSSLCDSTAKGKPDIELVDMTSRLNTLEEIMEVTTKPIILDGDTGGLVEHFVYNVQTLERTGISAVIIEDKQGLKKNSLFGTGAGQKQASILDFCEKITAGKNAQKTKDFMIIARCESLILEQGLDDALTRCHAYVKAGADGIMIEVHNDPVNALCDGAQSLTPEQFADVADKVRKIREVAAE